MTNRLVVRYGIFNIFLDHPLPHEWTQISTPIWLISCSTLLKMNLMVNFKKEGTLTLNHTPPIAQHFS